MPKTGPLAKSNSLYGSDFMKSGFNPFSAGGNEEVSNLKKKLEDLKLPEEARKIVEQEISKVSKLSPSNQEYHVSINYLQTISDLPWNTSDPEQNNPDLAREILDRDHFGLEAVKKRII